jgi:hypothetical protein
VDKSSASVSLGSTLARVVPTSGPTAIRCEKIVQTLVGLKDKVKSRRMDEGIDHDAVAEWTDDAMGLQAIGHSGYETFLGKK